MARRLSGKVAIITGASRGLGQYCALEYGREGAIVAVAARTEQETDPRLPGTIYSTAKLVDEAGGEGFPVVCNVGDENSRIAILASRCRLIVHGDDWPRGDYLRQLGVDEATEYVMHRWPLNLGSTIAAQFLIGATNWVNIWYEPTGPYGIDKIVADFVELTLNGLRGDKPHAIAPTPAPMPTPRKRKGDRPR